MYRGNYDLIGGELSMFSRKLEAQLRFQNIPFQWEFKTQAKVAEIETRAGTHFIPVLRTPDKWMIHDTIAIGPMLNARFPQIPVVPAPPLQRACCFILEDIFNHWLGRIAVHSRWCYPHNVAWVGPRFGANMILGQSIDTPLSSDEEELLAPIGQTMYESFGKHVCEYNGVGPQQSAAVKADFHALIDTLANHLRENDFLLGARPCLADFALVGACKAHFVTDPVPSEWLGQHSAAINAYVDRLFGDDRYSSARWPDNDAVPKTLGPIFDYAQSTYFRFAAANIAAGLRGDKFYDYDYGYGPVNARTQKRLNFARLHVQDELQQMSTQDDAHVQAYFDGRGILEHYLAR